MATTIIKSANSDNQALVDSTGHLYVTSDGGSPFIVSGSVAVIQETTPWIVSGSVAAIVSGSVTSFQGTNPWIISGSVTTIGSASVSGTVSTNLNGLTTFQTSQYSVGTSAVQLTPTPLVNRSSMSIKTIIVGTDIVYIGNSSGVTSSTGYPLFNGDSIQLDLISTSPVYAISGAQTNVVAVMEIGD